MRITSNDNLIAIKTAKAILNTIATIVTIQKKGALPEEHHLFENKIRLYIKNMERVGLYRLLIFWIKLEMKKNICICEDKENICFNVTRNETVSVQKNTYDSITRKNNKFIFDIINYCR